jgi:hypothetical protein
MPYVTASWTMYSIVPAAVGTSLAAGVTCPA